MACFWVGCATLMTSARENLWRDKFNSRRPWLSYSGRVVAYLETICEQSRGKLAKQRSGVTRARVL